MSITFNGIGSGLDIDAIVGAIVNAERAPTENRLNRLEESTTEELSAIGQLNSALNTFIDSAEDLGEASLFQGRSVSIGDRDLLDASAEDTAEAATYQIQIEQIATAQKVATQAVSAGTTEVGTGTINVYLGSNSFAVDITSENNTLSEIRDSINNSDNNIGVRASIINDDTGARLVLTSQDAGVSNTIAVTVDDDDGDDRDSTVGLSQLVYDPTDIESVGDGGVIHTGLELNAAQNAIVHIDGLTVTSESNDISGVIEGVSLNVLDAQDNDDFTNGDTINLTIGNDTQGTKSAIENFVEVYNGFIDVVDQLTLVVVNDGNTGNLTGALTGDSTVRNIVSSIRSQLSIGVESNPSDFQFLVNLGLSTDQEGRLTLDDTTLNNALDNNYDSITNLFSGEGALSERLTNSLSGYTGATGVIELRQEGLQTTLNSIDDQREALERRITLTEERLFAQYRAADALVGELNNTLNFLTTSLSANNRDDN